MDKKLKIALKNRSSEQGFAIPIAVGLGLIMIVVATTMIMRSQGDRVTASAQNATNRGLSAGETGITRYQSLINSNRVIATYNRTAASGSPSWANAATIPGLNNTCTGNVSGATAVSASSTTDWQDIDSTALSKGQYRLIDYVYQPDSAAATTPGIGTLTVEGRVNQVGNGNTASDGIGTATTRLQVKIRVAKQSSSGTIPGLWVQNVPQNMSSNMVNGNILVAGCTLPSGVSQSNVTSTNTVAANPNAIIPDTPPLPTSNLNAVIGTSNISSSVLGAWGQNFPRKNASGVIIDAQQPDGSYAYLVQGDLENPSASNITIQAGAKVVFYVQGKIDIGGNTNINVGGDASQMQIYGNTFLRNPNGTIQVNAGIPQTKYGCPITLPTIASNLTDPPITYTSTCPTRSVTLSGSGSISALIHAPDATGAVSGGGGNCSSSNGFSGALWFKKWDASLGSNTGNAVVRAKGDYGSFLATQNSAPPSIPSITAWERQEIP